MTGHNHPATWLVDAISGGAIIGSILGYVPTVAAIAGLAWYALQIWESRTAVEWRKGRRARKIARLKDRLHRLERER